MNVSFTDLAVINSLNLDRVRWKLMHAESGEGWDQARAEAAELEYRRFLYLTKKYPEERIAPSVEADTFWHYHILDTFKYAKDCEAIFGHFLHHDPNVGIGKHASPADQSSAAQRMWELYETEFGAAAPQSDARRAAWCTVTASGAATAWCTVAAPKAKSAWCTVARPKTAWCTVTAPRTAWCTVTGRKAGAAWCTVTAIESKAGLHALAAQAA